MLSLHRLYDTLRSWAEVHAIRVQEKRLDPETAGEFDGLSVAMNPDFDLEERCFYFVHALGSIVIWSLDRAAAQAIYDELRDARASNDPHRLEQAITGFATFEERASQYAVWILNEVGWSTVVPAYTIFARADLEMMVHFHRNGVAPVWREFFTQWKREVATGQRSVPPYEPKAVPPFQPVPIERQEVMQESDGKR